jgi:hypothetical protein
MSPITKYSISYLIFLAVLGGALFYWNATVPPAKVHPWSFYILGFFAIVFFLNHVFLLNAEDKRPAVFIRRFMATTALRLFLFMIVMLSYAVTHKELANLFIWHILVFYLSFTVFEIVSLYRHFQKK